MAISKSDGYSISGNRLVDSDRRKIVNNIPEAYVRDEALSTFVSTVTQAGQLKRVPGKMVDIKREDGLIIPHWFAGGITDDDFKKLIQLKTINGQELYGTDNINVSSSGGELSYSASQLGILTDGTDNTTTIQNLYNAGTRLILFNSGTAATYKVNGYLNIPGMQLKFEPGNKLDADATNGSGSVSITAYSRTVTGSGTTFTNVRPAAPLVTLGVKVVAKTSGGSGYLSSPPTVIVTGGGGTGAVVEAVVTTDGSISHFNVLEEGYNYTSVPTIVVSGGSGSGASGAATLGTKVFGVVESIESNTSLTMRDPASITMSAVPLKYYNSIISGGTVHAALTQQICTTNISLDCFSSTMESCVDWYGALGTGVVDDHIPMQKCIDDAAYFGRIATVRLGVKTYKISKGLMFRVGISSASPRANCATNFIGAGNWYDTNNGGGSRIEMTNGQSFGVGFQRCKGNIVSNIQLLGPNRIALGTDQGFDENVSYVQAGVRDNPYSVCSGWIIDPVGQASVDDATRFPTHKNYYTETNNSGSSGMELKYLRTSYFVVNYCNSLLQQNGEDITYVKCYSSNSKIGFGSYNSQAILCTIRDCQIWVSTYIAFDSAFPEVGSFNSIARGYGQGGQAFEVDGANLQNVKWVFRLAASYNTIRLNRIRGEVVYGWGGVFSPSGSADTTLFAENCWMNFAGRHADVSQVRANQFMLHVTNANFVNCVLVYYERPANPINFLAGSTSFVNCLVSRLGDTGNETYHVMTRILNTGGARYNGYNNPNTKTVTTSVTSSATVSNVDEVASTWQFTAGSATDIKVYDDVIVYSPSMQNEFKYGQGKLLIVGTVKSVNTSTRVVTVEYLGYGIENGLLLNTVWTKSATS